MAKMNDYMAGRQDGLQLAFTIVEKNGVDGLRDEIEFRNATQIHTMLDRKSLEIATRMIKEMTMDIFTEMNLILGQSGVRGLLTE